MIGYVTLGTNDLPRAMAFYDTLLAELKIGRLMAFGDRGHGWAAAMDKPMLCVFKPYDGEPATVGNGVMVGLAVASRDEVDRVHKKALELGGKDPMIVCADADLERAANGAVFGAFANAGQVCVSTERVYVVDSVAAAQDAAADFAHLLRRAAGRPPHGHSAP